MERKLSEQTKAEYLGFLDSHFPSDFSSKKNTGRYVEGDPGGYYLTIERNGELVDRQKGALNDLVGRCTEDNIVAVLETGRFRLIQQVNGELDGQDKHVVMGIAGPTAKQYGGPILFYIMGLDSSGPR